MHTIIEGTYKLTSFQIESPNGETEYPFGEDAIGYVHYTPTGHFSVQYMPKSLNDEPCDQSKVAFMPVSYFGTYEYNREKDYVVHHVEGSFFPNSEGLDKIRRAEIRGKKLTLVSPSMNWRSKSGIVANIKFEKQEEIPEVTKF
ncbi:lipocalin-like domain-containing protein [Sunxiuqinia sp. A32]|uniref:lipocalin-like domain-containing protein n=1 Tax=Sunxiuqinia sp. A32 TaxID=3461496 RepID=UPI004045632D